MKKLLMNYYSHGFKRFYFRRNAKASKTYEKYFKRFEDTYSRLFLPNFRGKILNIFVLMVFGNHAFGRWANNFITIFE